MVSGALADRGSGAAVAGLLAPHFTVFTYDRRGRGDSGDTPPYAVRREIDDLEAVIAETGASVYVVGGSSGAVLALEGALHGLSIARLALYEPPLIVDDSRSPMPGDYYQGRLRELLDGGRRGDALEFFMHDAVGVPAEAVAGMRQSPAWPGLEKIAPTLLYDGMVMGDMMAGSPAPLQRYASVGVRTLVMDGGASPEWMHHGVAALAGVLANATRKTLPDQTHAADPAVLAPALEEFFRD
jgi:pimeloyl-ACP methyl ester carboxylesterase